MVVSQFPARFGKYILLDRLNAGGMAEVFRAKVMGAEKFERLVAIKCMLPALLEDEQFISMFIDEAKLAAQLSHGNIVQIYELGRLKERLYIAMELIAGRDLRHIVRTARTDNINMGMGFAAYVISRAAMGLDYAHRKAGMDGQPLNLVHRDVSPQNILVSYDGEVKVVDFGIAKAEARATETQTGVLKGKFAYMAPEQVVGGDIDRRADIFALGAVLYEIVTGDRLFAGENDLSVLEKVREARTPDLNNLPPECLPLSTVLAKALQRDPNQRYSHASQMAEDLEELLIEDRTIFGPKRASHMMHALYEDEVAHLAERIRKYSEITADKVQYEVDGDDSKQDSVVFNTQPRVVPDVPMMELTPNDFESGRTDPAMAPPRIDTTVTPLRARPASSHMSPPQNTPLPAKRPPRSRVVRSAPPAPPPDELSVVSPAPPAKSGLGTLRLVMVLGVLVLAGLALTVSVKLHLIKRENIPLVGDAAAVRDVFSHFADPADTVAPVPSVVPLPRMAEQAEPQELDEAPKEATRYGWLSIQTSIRGRAKVSIDGHDVGYLPLAPQKVRAGQHEIRIIEEENGAVVKVRHAPVNVSPRHTRKAPRVVEF